MGLRWDHRGHPEGPGEHFHTPSQPLLSHVGQWLSFPYFPQWGRAGREGEAAWLSCATRCPLGQFACKWKRTFLGMNDERGIVLPLQPAVTIYEVSHVLGLCQRGGFDGQGLQRRDQPSMRPQSLGCSLTHGKEKKLHIPAIHPQPKNPSAPLLWLGLHFPTSHQGALSSSLPTDCLKLERPVPGPVYFNLSMPGRYKIHKNRNRKGKRERGGRGCMNERRDRNLFSV